MQKIQSILICLLFFIFSLSSFSQTRLILNGAKINISKGANLVINNANSNAMTRNNGYIITEGENNKIKWNIGATTGTYIIPLGYGANDYIPLTFTKTAGTGNGYFIFSSYHTGWNNTKLPTGVLNVSHNGVDYSPFTIDRFWQIDAAGYSSKPALTNLIFTYIDAEWSAIGNHIDEHELGVQRWNPYINDWGDFIPAVGLDNENNKITVGTVSASNLLKWWTLPDLNGNNALPVELTSFKGDCTDGSTLLTWSTASEFNNNYFLLQRSTDGNKWMDVVSIAGAGNSNSRRNYSYADNADADKNYYRLKQADFNNTEKLSDFIEVFCNATKKTNELLVYPNPTSGIFTIQNVIGNLLQIINSEGVIVYSQKCIDNKVEINLSDIASGIYTIFAANSTQSLNARIMIQH